MPARVWAFSTRASWEKAKEAILSAAAFGQASKNLGALAVAENYLGGICLRQGDLAQVVVHTRQALSYWEQVGYSWGMANTLNNLGILEVTGGILAAALINFEASLRLRRDMGDVEGFWRLLTTTWDSLGTRATWNRQSTISATASC